MKSILALIFILGIGGSALAQDHQVQEQLDKKTLKKYQKMEKREREKMEEERRLKEMKKLLESRQFVLEADYLSGRYGSLIPVVSNLNFIMIDSTTSVIQVGSASGMGYNGVGGITDEGRVTKFELDERKNGYSLKVYTNSSLSSFTIFFNVSASGNATARISGMRGGTLTYHGDLTPINESYIYQGHTTY